MKCLVRCLRRPGCVLATWGVGAGQMQRGLQWGESDAMGQSNESMRPGSGHILGT